jgi:Secretion system C-terminal sorting domain
MAAAMLRKLLLLMASFWLTLASVNAQCATCGNGVLDVGETSVNCPQDIPHGATCSSPCTQPTSFESTAGIRQAFDFVGTTTWTTAGLPAGWAFAGAPSPTTAGALPAADAYGAKAGLIQPNCSGSCTATNGFCIGNLASTQAVGAGGVSGKLGANFDGRANVATNLSYAALRGQSNPTLVSPTFDMSAVQGFKVQFWLFPSETSCGQLNSWGSCVGNAAFLDFSTNGGTAWSQVLQMDLNSSNIDMCSFNNSNTKWLNEGSWSRVCLTVYRTTTSPGNFYSLATGSSAASGIMVNSAFFTNAFKFRIRYSQTASCTAGITTTNPGRYLAIDFPVVTSGDEMIPCGISFANMCGYGADANDDGVGSSTLFSTATAFGTVRRGVHEAERGVEIFNSQNPATYASQNLSGSNFSTNFDLCNAEGGDKQCMDWRTNNNSQIVVYECITDWEAPTGATGINVQYFKGTTPASFGLSKVTAAGKTAQLGWRYSGFRFVTCGSSSDLNPGCNGYYFLSASLPTQFSRLFYALSMNSIGDSWTYYGASSCNHYFNGPYFAPIAVPDTLTGSGNYTICVGNSLLFTGLSRFCQDASGLTGTGSISVSGPNSYSDIITSGGQGSVPIVDAGVYTITASTPTSPAQCLNCSRLACITVSASDISNCGVVAYPGLTFWADLYGTDAVAVKWNMLHEEAVAAYEVQRHLPGGAWETIMQRSPESGSGGNYRYLDRNSVGGLHDYRLVVRKQNGETGSSEVVSVEMPFRQVVQVYPVPATEMLHVRVAGDQESFTAELYDIAGRKLIAAQVDGAVGDISVADLEAGIYLLKVVVAGKAHMAKVRVE